MRRGAFDFYEQSSGKLFEPEQKFVENFTRRFTASISGDVTEYQLEFYDIIESPPKATVVIKAKTRDYMLSPGDEKDSFTIINDLSGILELYNN